MSKTKILALIGILLLALALFSVKHMKDFARVKDVEIGSTPLQPGNVQKIIFTNNQSSRVRFTLDCHFKVRSDGKVLFSETITLLPNSSMEFDVNPELSGRELPRIVANKACEAIWHGPFGMKRSAWWVSWEYGKLAHKVVFK